MPRKKDQPSPAQDPALVAFFKGSKRTYEQNVDALLQQLDRSAARTRARRAAASQEQSATAQGVGNPVTEEGAPRPVAPPTPGRPPKRAAPGKRQAT